MAKMIFLLSVLFTGLYAQDTNMITLENRCLSCHVKQQIPSELIYRRYLMKYSTNGAMAEAMLVYLKNPKKKTSIMPAQFFLKFPMKPDVGLDNETLVRNIKAYLKHFDIKKKLILAD